MSEDWPGQRAGAGNTIISANQASPDKATHSSQGLLSCYCTARDGVPQAAHKLPWCLVSTCFMGFFEPHSHRVLSDRRYQKCYLLGIYETNGVRFFFDN